MLPLLIPGSARRLLQPLANGWEKYYREALERVPRLPNNTNDARSILALQESIPDLQELTLALQESIGASQVLIPLPEE